MPAKSIYLFGNWKMYLDAVESEALARALAASGATVPAELEVAVFPIALAFGAVRQALSGGEIALGAQNVHWLDKGGYTGEISAEMYRKAGARYALVGHSERRHLAGETNTQVRQKLEAALAAGLIPVLCTGETAKERDSGEAVEVVEAQLRSAFENLAWPADRPLLVVYEPVWAIGTGAPCPPELAEEMQAVVGKFLSALVPGSVPILLYGGSVRAANIANYIRETHIDGVLVGGASVKFESWLAILSRLSV